MLYSNHIYTVEEILIEAGLPAFDIPNFSLKNDISIGGIPCTYLSTKIRISNPLPLIVLAGHKQFKVEVGEE